MVAIIITIFIITVAMIEAEKGAQPSPHARARLGGLVGLHRPRDGIALHPQGLKQGPAGAQRGSGNSC